MLILLDLTFSLVPGPLLLLASVAFKVSALVFFESSTGGPRPGGELLGETPLSKSIQSQTSRQIPMQETQ
jgi:hypothetical protein